MYRKEKNFEGVIPEVELITYTLADTNRIIRYMVNK